MVQLNYADREIFYGNEALIIADIATTEGKLAITNPKLVTGLVSVGALEDQASSTNYAADDVPDHAIKKGATLLQGEMTFIQTSEPLKEDLLGYVKTPNGLGWSPTGNYKTKCIQYMIPARRVVKATGAIEEGWRVVVYPKVVATGDATKESETESVDGVDAITWTVPIQATASEHYMVDGRRSPNVEYEIWGDQAKDFATKMEAGLFVMLPDTELTGGTPVVGG